MFDLAKYSYVNAKIRVMLSNLISPSFFSRLMDSRDVYEVMELLQETGYKNVVEKCGFQQLDLKICEKELLNNDLDVYLKVLNSVSSKREKEIVSLFVQRIELEELKTALRLWHKEQPVDIKDYLLDRRIVHDIDFRRIITSSSIEEIILLLDDTPYRSVLKKVKEEFKGRKALFVLETALDSDYYQRLFSAVGRVSSTDRKIALKLLGIEIDILNINWLIKAKKYYAMATSEILEMIIPGGEKINKDKVLSSYVADGLENMLMSISFGPYVRLKDLIEGNISKLENFLYQILLAEIRRILSGFPFTIGTVLGYLILKRMETKTIVSLLYAKKYGYTQNDFFLLTGGRSAG